MRRVRESLELIFVTVFTGLTADVVVGFDEGEFRRAERGRLRGVVVTEPGDRGENEPTDQEYFDKPIHLGPPGIPFS